MRHRGPEKGSQIPTVTQQVREEGQGFRSGPGHGGRWGLRWEVSGGHTDNLLSVSTLHLLPGLQTQMIKWPQALTAGLSCTSNSICPSDSLSSPPGLQPASHTVHLISVPGTTIHWVAYVQSQESSSAPPSPSPGHPPSPNSSSSAPLEPAYSLCLSMD